MNSYNKNTVTIGDVWEEITHPKQHYNRERLKDNIIMRLVKTKSKSIAANIQIGMDICDLLKWKKGDKMLVMRNKLNGTQLRISKSFDDGYKLVEPNKNPCRMNINLTFTDHPKYMLSLTKEVTFELNKDHIIIDFSNLCR